MVLNAELMLHKTRPFWGMPRQCVFVRGRHYPQKKCSIQFPTTWYLPPPLRDKWKGGKIIFWRINYDDDAEEKKSAIKTLTSSFHLLTKWMSCHWSVVTCVKVLGSGCGGTVGRAVAYANGDSWFESMT